MKALSRLLNAFESSPYPEFRSLTCCSALLGLRLPWRLAALASLLFSVESVVPLTSAWMLGKVLAWGGALPFVSEAAG